MDAWKFRFLLAAVLTEVSSWMLARRACIAANRESILGQFLTRTSPATERSLTLRVGLPHCPTRRVRLQSQATKMRATGAYDSRKDSKTQWDGLNSKSVSVLFLGGKSCVRWLRCAANRDVQRRFLACGAVVAKRIAPARVSGRRRG